MATYILLITADAGGSGSIITWGTSGKEEYEEQIKAAGGDVKQLHIVTGKYDAVTVAEFEDDLAVLAFSLRAQAGGLYVEPLRAFSLAEVDEARSRLGDVVAARAELQEQITEDEPSDQTGG